MPATVLNPVVRVRFRSSPFVCSVMAFTSLGKNERSVISLFPSFHIRRSSKNERSPDCANSLSPALYASFFIFCKSSFTVLLCSSVFFATSFRYSGSALSLFITTLRIYAGLYPNSYSACASNSADLVNAIVALTLCATSAITSLSRYWNSGTNTSLIYSNCLSVSIV